MITKFRLFEGKSYFKNGRDISNFLKNFLHQNTELDIIVKYELDGILFYYKESERYYKHIFNLSKYNSNMFNVDLSVRTKKDYIPNKLADIVLFIDQIMEKYKNIEHIENIMNEINIDNFELYLKLKKYNL